jgi:hypothetical protein
VQLHPGNLATHPSCPKSLAISVLRADAAGLPHGIGYSGTCFETCMLLPWCCKCCSRGSTGCPPPDLHLATTCCAQAAPCPLAYPLCVLGRPILLHQPCRLHGCCLTTLSFHHSLSFRRTNHPNKTLKMLKILISAVQLQPSKGSRGSLVEFCQETPRGPNPWFHVFPPLPNSRGFTSIDLIRLQKRSTVHHPTALAAG